MKRIIALGLSLGFMLTACEVIEGPYKKITDDSFCSPGDTIRKTLLEDYTGQGCINCPDAATTAEDLHGVYGDCFIVLGIHVGFFSRPTPETPADFRTEVGTAWDNLFGLSPVGLPQGMVNRYGFDTEHVLSSDKWPSVVSQQVELAPDAFISIDGTYNSASLELDVDVTSTFINDYTGNSMLGVYLLEDSIVSPQKWQNPDGDVVIIEDYVHNHVLRESFNGDWGEALNTSAVSSGEEFTNNYSLTVDTAKYNDKHLVVVAFMYDADSKEIIQAEKAHVH